MKSFKYDNMILGADDRCVVSMDCHETRLNNNVLVMGGSGSGKTMGVVNPMLFNIDNTNVVGVFTKKGVTGIAKKHLEEKGYTVYTMDFTHPEKSEFGYDPFLYCRTSEDIRALAHAIVYGQESEERRDPFWDISAENLIYLVFNTVFRRDAKEGNTCIDAVNLAYKLRKYETEEINEMKSVYRLKEKNPGHHVVRNSERRLNEEYPLLYAIRNLQKDDPRSYDIWENFNRGADQTSASIAQSAIMPLDKVFNGEAEKMLDKNKPHFDFKELAKPKTALFVHTSPVNPAFDGLIAIFYQQLFKCIFEMAEEMENGELEYPVQVICDDFATGAKVPDFENLISIFREKKIASTILIQSISQLDSLYGKDKATTIINNCDTQIFMGGMDTPTCEKIAERLNLQNSCIYEMSVGKECFIRRGRKPFITDTYDFLKDSEYLAAKKGRNVDKARAI